MYILIGIGCDKDYHYGRGNGDHHMQVHINIRNPAIKTLSTSSTHKARVC